MSKIVINLFLNHYMNDNTHNNKNDTLTPRVHSYYKNVFHQALMVVSINGRLLSYDTLE